MFISIDYESAIFQAKKLESIANEYNEVLKCINGQLSAIDGIWEGSSAEAYKVKLNEYKQQNLKLQAELKQTANSIKQVVRIIQEADEAAATNSNSSGKVHGGSGRNF